MDLARHELVFDIRSFRVEAESREQYFAIKVYLALCLVYFLSSARNFHIFLLVKSSFALDNG